MPRRDQEAGLRIPAPIIWLGLSLWMACGSSHEGARSQAALPATAPVLFTAGDSIHGVQLWTSDGTPQGTRLMKQINPAGWAFPNSLATTFTPFDGKVYFPAQDPDHGYELWRSDGTTAGTQLVVDASPGPSSGALHDLRQPCVAGPNLFFLARTASDSYGYLWRLGPGQEAAMRLLDGYQGEWSGDASSPVPWNSELVFHGGTATLGATVWRTDGTPSGTRLAATGLLPMSALAVLEGRALFLATGDTAGGRGFGLWSCDLTTGDSRLLIPMADQILPHWDPQVGLRFNEGYALVEVWEGTLPDRYGLWRTDGTPEGTFRLADLAEPTGFIAQARGFQGRTWFAANDGLHGMELWVTDGTPGGTRMFKELTTGTNGSYPGMSAAFLLPTGGFFAFRGRLYFGAGGPNPENHVLWVSDGTPEGTRRLVGLTDGDARVPKLPAAFCAVGDTLYFSAQSQGNAPYTRQLWRTDGTPEGTRPVTAFDFGEYWNPIWTIVPNPRP